jgi:hypothetical protein
MFKEIRTAWAFTPSASLWRSHRRHRSAGSDMRRRQHLPYRLVRTRNKLSFVIVGQTALANTTANLTRIVGRPALANTAANLARFS